MEVEEHRMLVAKHVRSCHRFTKAEGFWSFNQIAFLTHGGPMKESGLVRMVYLPARSKSHMSGKQSGGASVSVTSINSQMSGKVWAGIIWHYAGQDFGG